MRNTRASQLLICLWLSYFLACGDMHASSTDPGSQAASFYQQGKYEEALTIWNGLVKKGQTGAGLYYNIGLAESRLGHTASAILAFEQALRIRPLNREINLALVEERKKIDNATLQVNSFFLIQWYSGFLSLLRPGGWSMLGLFLMFIFIFQFLSKLKIFRLRKNLRLTKLWWTGVAGVLCLLIAWLSYKHLYRTDEAILQTACELRQAPSDDSPLLRIVSPGEKIKIKDQIGEWEQVNLLNLDAGWLKKSCAKPILVQ